MSVQLSTVPHTYSIPVFTGLSIVAVTISLFVCFWGQFEHASSAVVTVIIIANTDRKAMFSKCIARIIGTVIACVAMNTIFANYGQAPWLFMITFALWMGMCVFIATLLPTPAFAYAATMSGLTVGVIAAQQTAIHTEVFLDSLNRFFVVSVGVITVGVVFGLVPAICHHFFKSPRLAVQPVFSQPLPTIPKNWLKATRDGLITVLVILVGTSFWMLTQWQEGSAMLLMYGIMIAQFIQKDEAVFLSILIFIGTVISSICGLICLFFILPYVQGFTLLIAALSIFLLPTFCFKNYPVFGSMATLYMALFIMLVDPSNMMTYNISDYLNEALAYIVGITLFGLVMAPITGKSLQLPWR